MNPGVHTKSASWLLQTVWGEICEQKRFINNGVTTLLTVQRVCQSSAGHAPASASIFTGPQPLGL